eukprot:PhF_6_TR20385/c0_g1_i1/m.29360
MSHIIVVCGSAGVGKTTYAQRLCNQYGFCLVDIDVCTEIVVQAGLRASGMDPNDRDSPRYKAIFRDAIHSQLFQIAQDQIVYANRSVVVVAPFTLERQRTTPDFPSWIKSQLSPHVRDRVNVWVVHCVCSKALRMERIQRRGNPRDTMKDSVGYYTSGVNAVDVEDVLPCLHFRVDTTPKDVSVVGPWTSNSSKL